MQALSVAGAVNVMTLAAAVPSHVAPDQPVNPGSTAAWR